MHKAMANKPEYLEATWKKIQATMTKKGALDSKTKDIVALTVSIMSGCENRLNIALGVKADEKPWYGCAGK